MHLSFQLDQADLGMMSRDYYMNGIDDLRLQAYEQYAVNVAMLFGANHSAAKQEMRDMILFEITLANVNSFPESNNILADRI